MWPYPQFSADWSYFVQWFLFLNPVLKVCYLEIILEIVLCVILEIKLGKDQNKTYVSIICLMIFLLWRLSFSSALLYSEETSVFDRSLGFLFSETSVINRSIASWHESKCSCIKKSLLFPQFYSSFCNLTS